MDLEIQTRACSMDPEWRGVIDSWVDRLQWRFRRILRLHVRLQRDRHHRQGTDEVHLLANLPGRTVTAAKRGESMVAAAHAAFEGLERSLDGLDGKRRGARRRREARESEAAPAEGGVEALTAERGAP